MAYLVEFQMTFEAVRSKDAKICGIDEKYKDYPAQIAVLGYVTCDNTHYFGMSGSPVTRD